MSARHRRVGLAVACFAFLSLAACAGPGTPLADTANDQDPGPVVTAIPETETGPTAELPTEIPTVQGGGGDYPDDPFAYAWEIVQAWGDEDEVDRLLDLTTAEVSDAMMLTLGYIADGMWMGSEDQECLGPTSGAWNCDFWTDHGDKLRLRISDALLGEAHAGIDADIDGTVYPTDPEDYVREFVDAWMGGNHLRMNWLASFSISQQAQALQAPQRGYLTCTEAVVGGTYVRAYGSGPA
jgi:hypothetical protein